MEYYYYCLLAYLFGTGAAAGQQQYRGAGPGYPAPPSNEGTPVAEKAPGAS